MRQKDPPGPQALCTTLPTLPAAPASPRFQQQPYQRPTACPTSCTSRLPVQQPASGALHHKLRKLLAYRMGFTSGWGEASKVVKWGTMSEPLKRTKAPLLPMESQ